MKPWYRKKYFLLGLFLGGYVAFWTGQLCYWWGWHDGFDRRDRIQKDAEDLRRRLQLGVVDL